jgi:hypothetical protein
MLIPADTPECNLERHTNAEAPGYRLGRDVVLVQQDEMGRLIDLERGRFYALDVLGTQMLNLTLRFGPAEAVRQIASEYEVPEERVRADCETFFTTLSRKRLVVPRSASGQRSPGPVTIWLLLALAWLCLRLLGWMGTVRLWRRGRVALAASGAEQEATVRRIDQAIRAVAARHPLNTQCKERALVSWHLLRNRLGLPAELVVGVMPYPFQAHAWVECGAVLVSDEPSRCETYTPAARFE